MSTIRELESEGLCRLSKDSAMSDFYFPDGSVWMFQEYRSAGAGIPTCPDSVRCT